MLRCPEIRRLTNASNAVPHVETSMAIKELSGSCEVLEMSSLCWVPSIGRSTVWPSFSAFGHSESQAKNLSNAESQQVWLTDK